MSLLLTKLQSLTKAEEIVQCLEDVLESKTLDVDSVDLFLCALESQLKKDWFEPKLVIALMKLVQFFPDESLDYDYIIKNSLLKAFSELPDPCLRLLLMLVPQRFQNTEIVEQIMTLHGLLETSDYKEMWSTYRPLENDFTQVVPKMSSKLQQMVFNNLKIVFATIAKERFLQLMGVDSLEQLAKGIVEAITLEDNLVVFPESDQTRQRPQEAEKLSHIKLSNLRNLLSHLGK